MIRIFLHQAAHYRDFLLFLLNNTNGYQVVGTTGTSSIVNLINQIHEGQPNLILLDISLENSMEVFNRIKKYDPTKKIIVLTNANDIPMVQKYLGLGIDGYLLINKTTPPVLLDSLRAAYDNGFPISPSLMSEVLKMSGSLFHQKNLLLEEHELTTREMEILQLLVAALSYKEISFRLNISLDTVRSHIRKIYDKLHVNSKSEAIIKALKSKIINIE